MKMPTMIDYVGLYDCVLYPYQKKFVTFIENQIKLGKGARCLYLSTPCYRPNIFFELMKKNDSEKIEPTEEGTEGGADTEIG